MEVNDVKGRLGDTMSGGGRRMYDAILDRGLTVGRISDETLTDYQNLSHEKFWNAMHDAVPIDASEAADYFFARTLPGSRWKPGDLPTVAPPFETFFVEITSSTAGAVPTRDRGWETIAGKMRWGVLFQAFEPLPAHPEGARWVLTMSPISESGAGFRVLGLGMYMLDEHGQIMDSEHNGFVLDAEFIEYAKDEGLDWTFCMLAAFGWCAPGLFAVSLMHCTNVELVERRPHPKLSRAHEKRHGRPLASYHVLRVEPMTKALDDAGAATLGLKRALHLCRGHFKDYREHGLFGRLRGVYWWGPQLRGSGAEGLVEKSYEVAPPDPMSQNVDSAP